MQKGFSLFWVVCLIFCLTNEQSRAQVPPSPVVAVDATEQTMVETVDAIGFIYANRQVPIQAEISDRIAEILVSEGARVEKGDLLFQLDDTLEAVRLRSAQQTWKVKNDAVERAKQLIKRNAMARAKLAEIEAEATLAQVSVEKAQIEYDRTKVRAPFSGVLGSIVVEEGDYAEPGKVLSELFNMSPLMVRFTLPQKFLPVVKEGQKLSVWSSARPDNRFSGAISFIDPSLDPETKSIQIKGKMDETGHLRPGLYVSVSVQLNTIENAITIPDDALIANSLGLFVYKIENDMAKKIPVETGLRKGEQVQITKGIKAQDQIVTEGQLKLYEGAPVTVQKTN